MSLSITCPGCGAQLKTRESSAGKTRRCPKCKSEIVLPSFESVKTTPATVIQQTVETTPSTPVSPVQSDKPNTLSDFDDGWKRERKSPTIVVNRLSSLETTLTLVRAFVWLLFLAYLTVVVLFYIQAADEDKTVMHQSARAAMAMFWLIAGYTGARALDSILRPR
jgi:uncharacterized paraquat-inducible protein A